jgi:hypothetical protein
MSVEKEINAYLFYEFGYDAESYDEEKVSENWPFTLELLETLDVDGEAIQIFRFINDNEWHYALYGSVLNYYPVDGVELKYFKYQLAGSSWIAKRNPITLEHVVLGDPKIPSTKERVAAIKKLAARLRKGDCRILEGLFLKRTGEYLSLIEFKEEDVAHVVGTNITLRGIPFPNASTSRRLAIGIGWLLAKGDLAK